MKRLLAAITLLSLTLSACAGGNKSVIPSAPTATKPRVSSNSIPFVPPGPRYDNCPVFPTGDTAYNVYTNTLPLDPNSAAYIAGLGTNKSWDNDTAEYLNTADNNTPTLPVQSKVQWHTMPAEPWLSSFLVENNSDAHSFVLQTDTCHIYELYQTSYVSGTLSAYSGGDWDLTQPFVVRAPGSDGPNATGTSMFAGAVKYPELAAGVIRHALLLIVPYNMLAQWQFVSPATSTDGIPYEGPGPMALPYGAKLLLRSDYPTTGLGIQALAVVTALKKYGAIVSDTGCCYKLIYMHDLATPDAFDFSDLDQVKPAPQDWVVPQLPAIQTVPGHLRKK